MIQNVNSSFHNDLSSENLVPELLANTETNLPLLVVMLHVVCFHFFEETLSWVAMVEGVVHKVIALIPN